LLLVSHLLWLEAHRGLTVGVVAARQLAGSGRWHWGLNDWGTGATSFGFVLALTLLVTTAVAGGVSAQEDPVAPADRAEVPDDDIPEVDPDPEIPEDEAGCRLRRSMRASCM